MHTPTNKKELQYLIYSKNIPLDEIDTSRITDMSFLFKGKDFDKLTGSISNWNVSNVNNMSYMFFDTNFNQDISKWDVSNVIDMSSMFNNTQFNKDISNWNVSNVTDMYYMFCDSKFNKDISNWNVSAVTSMSYMFRDSKFNQDISKWNTSSVFSMSFMFLKSKISKVQEFKNQKIFPWDMYNGTEVEKEWKEILEVLKFISGR